MIRTKMRSLWVVAVLAGTSPAADVTLMPWPAQIEQRPGFLSLDHSPRFEVTDPDPRVKYAVRHFREQFRLRTGALLDLGKPIPHDGPLFVIHCKSTGKRIQALGDDESYQIAVDEMKADLTAATPLGVLRGVETLLQLIQPGKAGWIIPAVRIDDHPRFPWRGLMIDSARHFMPVDVIKRNIDGMAAVKLNILHLHLSDDEGFRVESLRCPRLQKLASDGAFYTQVQIRDLVAYARERGIRVVPEFDMPAHAVSWLIAYPQLSSSPVPRRLVRDMTDHERPSIDPTRESTYRLLDTVLGEMASLFPDKYFHIGGDEVDGRYWDQNERIQRWMRIHKIQDNHALQAYFNKRVRVIVAKHGKRMEGWDEILSPDLPKDTLVQSWRGPETLANAARMGFQTLLSAGWYLDLMHPDALWRGALQRRECIPHPGRAGAGRRRGSRAMDGICDAGESGQPDLAASGSYRREIVVAGGHYRSGIHVSAPGGLEPEPGMARPWSSHP